MRLEKITDNLHVACVGKLRIWFSYETPIAFKGFNGEFIVCENKWTKTTGKHLNHISDKENRLDFRIFSYLLQREVDKIDNM